MADPDEIPLHSYATWPTSVEAADSEAQSRTPPLKNDGPIFTRLFRKTTLPRFEQSLRDEAKNHESIEKRGSFELTYRSFASRSLSKVLRSIVWYHRFASLERGQPEESFPENLLQHKDVTTASRLFRWDLSSYKDRRAVKSNKKATYNSLLEDLSDVIGSAQGDCFELCVITAHIPLSHQAFTFSQKLRASISGDLAEMYDYPKLAVLYVLRMHWQFDYEILQSILHPEPVTPLRRGKTVRPSKIQPRASVDVFQRSDFLKSCMTLQWYSKCEGYEGDFQTYVWQTYSRPPKPDYLRLYLETGKNSNVHRCIVVFKTQQLSKDFARLLSFSIQDTEHSMAKGRNQALELAETVVLLFKFIAEGSENFITGLSAELEYLKYEGRKSASGSKIQFLLHLNDCRIDALRCLNECLLLLGDTATSLSTYAELEDTPKSRILEELVVCEKDLAALIAALEGANSAIERTRIMIDQQLQLAQVRHQSVLAIVAALYLPLAYVSGIFGMNLTNTSLGLDEKYTNITNLTNNATLDFTRLSPSQVDDILTVVGNSGTYAWDFKWYWITLVPLLFGSIVLPILAGPIIRVICQSIARYRVYWRIGGFILVIFYIIGVHGVFWNYLQETSHGRVNGLYHKYKEGEGYRFSMTSSFAAIWVVYFVVTAGPYSFVALYQLYWAFKRKHKRFIWLAFLLIVAAFLSFRAIGPIGVIEVGSYYGPTVEYMEAAFNPNQTTVEFWLEEGYSLENAVYEANMTAERYQRLRTESKGPLFTIDSFSLAPWVLLCLGWTWPGIKRLGARIWKGMAKSA